jgi:anti-sigma-K factor RskA
MKHEGRSLDGHERFRELAALANSGTLSAAESFELERHLQTCSDCRQIYDQYRLICSVGMPYLAATYSHTQELEKEQEHWDDSEACEEARDQLLARVRELEPPASDESARASSKLGVPHLLLALARNQNVRWAVAACLAVAVGLGAYRLGRRAQPQEDGAALQFQAQVHSLAAEKKSSDEIVESQAVTITQVEAQNAQQQQEIAKLRASLVTLDRHSKELADAGSKAEEELRTVSEQRDAELVQLRQAEQSYQKLQAELVSLRAEHDRALLHTAALESKVEEFSAANREQERRLGDDEQFLASDRDIRELMGARKLYIADVFDVDSGSRTRKPFGRVFYTQNKSLIFYAFDLDHQAGVKNASIFQVWGQKDTELSEKAHAMNLGILYMDSESNRRWVLRLDDAKQLAEIDAVFVTVEPHGGSPKPTGKPFLYALLRKEANHP